MLNCADTPGALAAALFSDNVPEEVYRNLINSVHKNIKPLHKYVKLRGRALGINKMKMYDLAVPIVGDCRREYSWEETVKTVKQALAPLGGEYGETLNRAFTERWVDISPAAANVPEHTPAGVSTPIPICCSTLPNPQLRIHSGA